MESDIPRRTFEFAKRMVRLCRFLEGQQGVSRILVNQLIRSGTSIGANVEEGVASQSRADFRAKMNIALKEASETEYWLELLHESDYISEEQFQSIIADNIEIIKILTSIVKNADNNV